MKILNAELLSGREIRFLRIGKVESQGLATGHDGIRQEDEQRHGWGMEYELEHTHREREDVGFSAQGIIRTADGRDLAFSLELDMSREYIEKNILSIRAGDAPVDPLVINFDGNAADLTSLKFEFDLDVDGISEQVPIPTSGRASTLFDIRMDSTNELLGRIRATGIYLKEDGRAGTAQQLDLAA